jgi:hypothetical protein
MNSDECESVRSEPARCVMYVTEANAPWLNRPRVSWRIGGEDVESRHGFPYPQEFRERTVQMVAEFRLLAALRLTGTQPVTSRENYD